MSSFDHVAGAPGSDDHRQAIQRALLDWWDAGHRDLPWRRGRDPYEILVSETMLQQTQAERVIPKYRAFLAQFPTLAALANASPADVIRAWAGLGYNRRAVNLHRMARVVVDEHGGRLPAEVVSLERLPGVGPYTARAVASIAFGVPAAAVDTNVRRVLTRILHGDGESRPARAAQELADTMLVTARPGEWNQVLMELGARVCTGPAPRCSECPVRRLCAAEPAIRAVRESGARYRAPRQARPQGRFTDSVRFWRGRVIDVLRAHPVAPGLHPAELGRCLRLDFGEQDLPWLHRLLSGLARDGLVEWAGGDSAARLPR
jgi:A/G-specific adenine glycosylase